MWGVIIGIFVLLMILPWIVDGRSLTLEFKRKRTERKKRKVANEQNRTIKEEWDTVELDNVIRELYAKEEDGKVEERDVSKDTKEESKSMVQIKLEQEFYNNYLKELSTVLDTMDVEDLFMKEVLKAKMKGKSNAEEKAKEVNPRSEEIIIKIEKEQTVASDSDLSAILEEEEVNTVTLPPNDLREVGATIVRRYESILPLPKKVEEVLVLLRGFSPKGDNMDLWIEADGSFSEGKGGAGWMVKAKDKHSDTWFGISQFGISTLGVSAYQMEALGLQEALTIAIWAKANTCRIEGDNKSIYGMLESEFGEMKTITYNTAFPWFNGGFCQLMAKAFEDRKISISWKGRENNKLADEAANEARDSLPKLKDPELDIWKRSEEKILVEPKGGQSVADTVLESINSKFDQFIKAIEGMGKMITGMSKNISYLSCTIETMKDSLKSVSFKEKENVVEEKIPGIKDLLQAYEGNTFPGMMSKPIRKEEVSRESPLKKKTALTKKRSTVDDEESVAKARAKFDELVFGEEEKKTDQRVLETKRNPKPNPWYEGVAPIFKTKKTRESKKSIKSDTTVKPSLGDTSSLDFLYEGEGDDAKKKEKPKRKKKKWERTTHKKATKKVTSKVKVQDDKNKSELIVLDD